MASATHASRILRHLFRRGIATRAQMARHLRIRKGTVGEVCDALTRAGEIHASAAGRIRSVDLCLVPDRFTALGVDHRPDGLQCCILRADGLPAWEAFLALPPKLTGDPRMRRIAAMLANVVAEQDHSRLVALAFCDVGMFNSDTGRSIRAAAVPGWEDIDLLGPLRQAVNLPVSLHGKLDAFCRADRRFGASRDKDTLLFVMVSHFIGLSMLIRDRAIRGSTSIFGELGHVVVDPMGDLCACGNRGCLETLASTDAIVRKVIAQIERGGPPLPNGARSVTLDTVIAAARGGHKAAKLALTEAARAIGGALAHLLAILGLRDVVLAGELTAAGDLLLGPLEETIRRRCIAPLNAYIRLGVSDLSVDAIPRGAAYQALCDYFNAVDPPPRELAA